jgi:hypothetical protein
MSDMRRRLLGFAIVAAPLLGLAGCASGGYGSGGGFEDYDDCYDGYCVGYDAYGRIYERPKQPVVVARGDVDRVDRSHGTPQTVSRDVGIRPASPSASGRMSVSPPSSARPAPATASRP